MATYKGIKGVKVPSLSSDPTASESEGSVWYNTTGSALKFGSQGAAAFASGPALNNSRGYFGGGGTQTAAQVAGGSPAPMDQKNETYDGSSWTEGTALNIGHSAGSMAGATNTASICFAGGPGTTSNESWNGST